MHYAFLFFIKSVQFATLLLVAFVFTGFISHRPLAEQFYFISYYIDSLPKIIPVSSINLDPFQKEIELQLDTRNTQFQVREWLSSREIFVSKSTFQRQIIAWDVGRQTKTSVDDPKLISAINIMFHATQHDDETIARDVTSQGIYTTSNQVKEICLALVGDAVHMMMSN